jgi:nucleotide-binding universal stress UspA family protein
MWKNTDNQVEGYKHTDSQRRPLRRILLLVRGEATDEATVEWGLHLAQTNNSEVTLLVVLPAPLSDSGRHTCALSDLLAGHSLPGKYVRRVLRRLVDAGVNATLKLNQGSPERQVRQEVKQEVYDLIIISAEPSGRLLEKRLEPLITPLLMWTERPLLIARVQQADHETVELGQGGNRCN